jgi:hypothetical protein
MYLAMPLVHHDVAREAVLLLLPIVVDERVFSPDTARRYA